MQIKQVINIVAYILVLAGCSFTAWLIYVIVSESYVIVGAGVGSSFPPPLRIVITSPATNVVSQPMIQVIGYFPKEIETITYDITNAAGTNVNQVDWQRKGYVTGEYLDRAKFDRMARESFENRRRRPNFGPGMERLEPPESAFTTNFFQLYDINLAMGRNLITIDVTDKCGRHHLTKKLFILDYTHDRTPPALTLIWPTNNTAIAGDNFTLNAQVDDDTATIKTIIKDAGGSIHEGSAIIERNGLVWVKNLPLGPGANKVTVVATDAAGNCSTNIFSVQRSSVSVTMQPLERDQLNQPFVKVHGTISDVTCEVAVNGITATVYPNGSWDAQAVPVSPTGAANFKISVFRKHIVQK